MNYKDVESFDIDIRTDDVIFKDKNHKEIGRKNKNQLILDFVDLMEKCHPLTWYQKIESIAEETDLCDDIGNDKKALLIFQDDWDKLKSEIER